MIPNKKYIIVSGISVEVTRKNIKNLHLKVCPPDGDVRMSIPKQVSDDNARLLVESKLDWIKQKRSKIKTKPREPKLEFVSGELHYFRGKPFRLNVINRKGKQKVFISDDEIYLYVKPNSTAASREKVLTAWYREQIKGAIEVLLEKWQPIIRKQVSEFGVKKMKTRWGTCNTRDKRIWLNLELIKRDDACLEYVLVHELVHLLERYHNRRFYDYMDSFLPNWKQSRERLNALPLSHINTEC